MAETDAQARATLRPHALAYVDRVIAERDEAVAQLDLAVDQVTRLAARYSEQESEAKRLRERVQALQGVGPGASLAEELAREAGRGIELRRAVEETLTLLEGAQNLRTPPTTSVAAAYRKLNEAVTKWRQGA